MRLVSEIEIVVRDWGLKLKLLSVIKWGLRLRLGSKIEIEKLPISFKGHHREKKGAFLGKKRGKKKGAPLYSDKHLLLYFIFFSFHFNIAFVYQKCPIFALLTGGGEYRKILAWAQGSF